MINLKTITLRKGIKDIKEYFKTYKIIFDDESFYFLDKNVFNKL